MYYGDEIAMGDNIYLGDRDGVRTPMQWTPDRNGGFSTADFAQLYLPALMDPVYGYAATNVEQQLRNPGSLLHWVQRMISARRQHPVFGTGSFEALDIHNAAVFAYLRRQSRDDSADDIVLCLNNLSKVLRDRKKIKAKIRALSQEAKASAAIVGSLPFIILGGLTVLNPAYLNPLWDTTLGNVMVIGSGVWMVLGILIMRKIINFDF